MGNEGNPDISRGLLLGVGVFLVAVLWTKLEGILLGQFWFRVGVWLLVSSILTGAGLWANWIIERNAKERALDRKILAPSEGAVYCGTTSEKEEVFIKPWQRSMHTQVIGTTNAGKTESVILPWAIQDIEQGRGLVLIDGKADRGLLDKLWAYAVLHGRSKDFRLCSLSSIESSHTFNPLIGGSPEEISERVFNSFEFENEYYRSIQFEAFSQTMRIFALANEIPTFKKLHQALSQPKALAAMARDCGDDSLKDWAEHFRDLPNNERTQRVSGLLAAISHFAFGKASLIFNAEEPAFTVETALSDSLILYFQLPVLLSPFLGRAAGKMILQCIQSAVANRHRSDQRKPDFYSIFLDDFSEYLYPGFVSILNKSRSANVGIVFAHQALGDIQTLGDAIANSILTNANLKVFMRGNDPDSAEYFSRVIGTEKTIKYTERTKKELLTQRDTGDASAREVDEFTVHPNRFKRELGVGEAMMLVPHERGIKTVHVKFRKYDDLTAEALPSIQKPSPKGLSLLERTIDPKEAA
jgi:hypothetical protein